MGMRVQKVLAQAGVASRRASEELVRAGRVRVNGKPAVLGMLPLLTMSLRISL